MEFTIKIVNTPDHSLFPSGREYYFLINPEHKVQELIKMIHATINRKIKIPKYLTFSLMTEKNIHLNYDFKINSYFSTDKELDIKDRNENIFYLYFHSIIPA